MFLKASYSRSVMRCVASHRVALRGAASTIPSGLGTATSCQLGSRRSVTLSTSSAVRRCSSTPNPVSVCSPRIGAKCGGDSASCGSESFERSGVMTLAGKGVEVLVSPSGDMAKILSCVHGIESSGTSNFKAGLQVPPRARTRVPRLPRTCAHAHLD